MLRSRSRTSIQGQALVRLGIGLAVLPLIWSLTLVLFLDVEFARIGPGPWVTMAGGVLVWLAGRSLLTAPAAPAAEPWARRSTLVDLAVIVVAELVGFGVFLLGIEIDDPGEFLGFFIALTTLGATLSTLGVYKGLAGPFGRNEGFVAGPAGRAAAAVPLHPGREHLLDPGDRPGRAVRPGRARAQHRRRLGRACSTSAMSPSSASAPTRPRSPATRC